MLTATYDPDCHACHGSGTDVLFDSPCTECGPTSTVRAPRGIGVNGRTFPGDSAGSGRARATQVERPSDKQLGFIRSLMRDEGVSATDIDGALDVITTKKMASIAIEKLLGRKEAHEATSATPAAPSTPAQPQRRPNRYGGKCHLCGGYVPEGEGWLAGTPGNWASEHKVCPEPPKVPAAQAEPGMYWLIDGRACSVQWNRAGTRLYAKVWNGTRDDSRFEYEPGAMRLLDRRMTVEEAIALSRELVHCAICGRHLTHPDSVERGIGPVCITKI